MAKIEAVDFNAHKGLLIDPSKAELHGSEQHLIPTVLAEFTNIAVQNPIVLTKNGDTGEFIFAGMYGFEAYENLFWQQGQWQGLYLPLQIQRQPFFVGGASDSTSKEDGEHIVCIDVESPTIDKVSQGSGIEDNSAADETNDRHSLFSETGGDSEYFTHAKQCLAQILQGEQDNKNLINALLKFELIQPLSLEVTFANEASTRLNGLYTIDQEKLANLPSESVTALHQQGLLQPIYTMISSLGQIYALITRKNASFSEGIS